MNERSINIIFINEIADPAIIEIGRIEKEIKIAIYIFFNIKFLSIF